MYDQGVQQNQQIIPGYDGFEELMVQSQYQDLFSTLLIQDQEDKIEPQTSCDDEMMEGFYLEQQDLDIQIKNLSEYQVNSCEYESQKTELDEDEMMLPSTPSKIAWQQIENSQSQQCQGRIKIVKSTKKIRKTNKKQKNSMSNKEQQVKLKQCQRLKNVIQQMEDLLNQTKQKIIEQILIQQSI